MVKVCSACKWYRLRNATEKERNSANVTMNDLDKRCEECFDEFRKSCAINPRTCFTCEWKDRNLPYPMRKARCSVCVEEFVAKSDHDCTKCPWNNPKRRMPTDATLAHCEACIASVGSDGAMSCDSCKWRDLADSIRRPHCLRCSVKFVHNSKVRNSTNELSNKGQTIISYDNHNSDMTDDRDTVTKIASEYTAGIKSGSGKGTVHPVFDISSDLLEEMHSAVKLAAERFEEALADVESEADYEKVSKANVEYATAMRKAMNGGIIAAYEKMKNFIYEMCQLTDMQALLLLSEIRGDRKTEFARNHNLKDTAVNIIFKQIVYKSPIFKDFIILSRGSLQGTRGRKSKDGKSMERVSLNSKKDIFAGVFQPTFAL